MPEENVPQHKIQEVTELLQLLLLEVLESDKKPGQ